MFLILICCMCTTAVLAVPQNYYQQQSHTVKPFVPIIAESNEINPDGSFSYSYTTGDGQQAQAQGYLKNAGNKDTEAEVIQGSYSYTASDGTPITVTYIADEFGFRAEGAHLPTPPPIPEAIQQSLALIAQAQKQPQSQNTFPQSTYPQSSYKPQYPRPFRY
ncbi:endocuticle structural glycoprotein SgAbd-2-like [Anoplophora glabripennis]|uniref:endocuticle structural glycoprotein SgAbd-2-like n=1 Tax=Anoplophora glabripennis TaxID=217634 RepID=UPI000874449F|nr:endocuticle structural glycoprotein SgAbd-2-like [Anoplophora glabripennis]